MEEDKKEIVVVTPEDSQNDSYINQAIFFTLRDDKFLGNVLQELNVSVSQQVQTAALSFNKKSGKYNIYLNADFFKSLTIPQRIAVFIHEIMHFTMGHIFRFDKIGTEKDSMLKNIAADMSINQYIKNLPDDCIKVDDWKMKDGTPFPKFSTLEVYFDLIKQTTKPTQDKGEGNEEGEDGNSPENGQGSGQREKGDDINHPQLKKYKQFDEHDWENLTDEEKQRMLQEAKNVFQRTVEKMYNDYSLVPDSIKDMLKTVDDFIEKLNYKNLLKFAIKKTLNSQDRSSSWNRMNKRYGNYAPGSTLAKVPAIHFYPDCSGSISQKEINQAKQVIDGFLGAGSKKCMMGMWHTRLFSFKKYQLGRELDITESGGTDPQCVINNINKTNPDLAIILTDGEYGDMKFKGNERIIWIISKNGNIEHSGKAVGKTIKLDDTISE